MKGSKRNRYVKDGEKLLRKWYKKTWNKKVRKKQEGLRGCTYKKVGVKDLYEVY